MNEAHPSDHPGVRIRDRLRRRGRFLWDGLCRNVQSSLTVSINFESSIALLVFYGFAGYGIASMVISSG